MGIFNKAKITPKITGNQTCEFNTLLKEYPNTKECDMILSNVFVQSLLYMQVQHILSSNLQVKGKGWQADKWNKFLRDKSYDIFTEWYSQAFVYGQAHADFMISYDTLNHVVISDLIPFDMYNTTPTNTDIYYIGKKIDKTRISTLTLRTKAGQALSCANQLNEPIRELNDLMRALPESVIRNCLGSINIRRDPNSMVYATADQINAYKKEINQNMAVVSSLDGVVFDYISNKDIRDYTGFEQAINKILNTIYQYLGMSWLSMGITETGAYNAYIAALENYAKYLEVQCDRICAVLNNIVAREALWNGESTQISFVHNNVTFENELSLDLMIKNNTVKDLLAAGVVTPNEVRQALKLQPLVETTESGNTIDSSSSFESALEFKKGGVLKAIKDALTRKQNGGALQFTLTDKKKFAKLLNIDEKSLDTEWLKYETRFKDLIRQSLETNAPIENLFEPVWNEITGELRNLYAL